MIQRAMLLFCTTMMLSGCAGKNYDPVEDYLSKRGLFMPSATQFQSCRGYGCQHIDTLELTSKEWKQIEKPFKHKAKTAKQERKQIIQSIAIFEQIVGEYTGTSEDIWGTFQKTGHKQQDCVDESINTSIYMLALQQRGHINFHTIGMPQSRVPFLRWPHQTATIRDNETEQLYAIDSWFFDNGKPPVIIEFETWKKGWKPEKDLHEKNNDEG